MPTNFKKLVEHYADIIAKTQQKPSVEALNFFEKLGDNAALKELIKQIKLANERVFGAIVQKDVQVITTKAKVVEKKVTLPPSWIKGLTRCMD